MSEYDPFVPGRFPVGVRTIHARDKLRDRVFPCEIWQPEGEAAKWPLILFSHSSGAGRKQSPLLCEHLSSHGYVVAAMDHSEVVAPELARKDGESIAEKTARGDAWIANRVPDIRFLLDHLLASQTDLDPARIGIVGHSFGGWTALAAPEVEERIGAIVALAPAGSSRPKPGIIPAKLTFTWGRDVPTLYLAGENDVAIPLSGVYELFERTRATRELIILRRADHLHFMDHFVEVHETVRGMEWPGELAWMPKEMLPIGELCSEEEARLFVRGLTLCHMDAVLRRQQEAARFLAGDIGAELASRGIDAMVHRSPISSR
jgi:dienelactone hydrolase